MRRNRRAELKKEIRSLFPEHVRRLLECFLIEEISPSGNLILLKNGSVIQIERLERCGPGRKYLRIPPVKSCASAVIYWTENFWYALSKEEAPRAAIYTQEAYLDRVLGNSCFSLEVLKKWL